MPIRPVAILVAFPIGGLLANLVVDGVDSVGAALLAGLIAGALIGVAEWSTVLRRVSWLWIPGVAGACARTTLDFRRVLVGY